MVAYGQAGADSGQQTQAGQRLWPGARKRKHLSQGSDLPNHLQNLDGRVGLAPGAASVLTYGLKVHLGVEGGG